MLSVAMGGEHRVSRCER